MRPFLLIVLLILPAFAGCTSSATQWAGIAHAYQYRTSSLVELQLHVAGGNEPATIKTASAGLSLLDRVENATATVILPSGASRPFRISEWTIDRDNETLRARIPISGFDGFHFNGTFVLKNGTTLRPHEEIVWTEVFSRPFHGIMKVNERSSTSTSYTFTIYELHEGAARFEYEGTLGNNTMSPAALTHIERWRLRLTGHNGTSWDDDTQPNLSGGTLNATLPYANIARVEAFFELGLRDGMRITEHEVDGDGWPLSYILQKEREQRN